MAGMIWVDPYPPRCHWTENGKGCERISTHRLIDDEGRPNPGGYFCTEHGEALVEDIAEQLGEQWDLWEIVPSKPKPDIQLDLFDDRKHEVWPDPIDERKA